jgi:hypothetical protein
MMTLPSFLDRSDVLGLWVWVGNNLEAILDVINNGKHTGCDLLLVDLL